MKEPKHIEKTIFKIETLSGSKIITAKFAKAKMIIEYTTLDKATTPSSSKRWIA